MSAGFLPDRVEVRHYRLGSLFAFAGDNLPGLHVAAPDLRVAFDLLAPVTSELVRRATGVGVTYALDETLSGFRTRMTLLSALRPAAQPEAAPDLFGLKLLTNRRLIRALHAMDARELGKRDRHAGYWRAASGRIFSVMGPTARTQSGTLLYTELYARDLLNMVARLAAGSPVESEAAVTGRTADLVLRLEPV